MKLQIRRDALLFEDLIFLRSKEESEHSENKYAFVTSLKNITQTCTLDQAVDF